MKNKSYEIILSVDSNYYDFDDYVIKNFLEESLKERDWKLENYQIDVKEKKNIIGF